MTKRALLVGCTGGGLPECAGDAQLMAAFLSRPPFNFECKIVIQAAIQPKEWEVAKDFLLGADVAILFYSGHGFRQKLDGKVFTGIWSGVPITHALFNQYILAPLRGKTGTIIRVYDCCYAGSARVPRNEIASPGDAIYKSGAAPDFVSADPKQTLPTTIKCMALCPDDAPAKIEHYQSANDRDVVIAACGPRQFSYGSFEPAPWSPLDTNGCSYFTWCLAPSLYQSCQTDLRKGVQSAQWRSNHGLEYLARDAKWRMAPGVKFPLPDIQLSMPRGVPGNILIK